MDWTTVKKAIGTIAPMLAGTLGSPVAGVAVKSHHCRDCGRIAGTTAGT
jgi:hypothetical protein